jgi:hypothetical protein
MRRILKKKEKGDGFWVPLVVFAISHMLLLGIPGAREKHLLVASNML